MASGALRLVPWLPAGRARLKLDVLASRAWSQTKNHFSASYQLSGDHPSAKALEKIPYPTTPVDHSIFEEETDEYTAQASSDVTLVSSPQMLLHLVEQHKYTAASKLRSELVDMGVSIPPNLIYENAVNYCLSSRFVGDRVQEFSAWFSLIPDATAKIRAFRHLRRTLFRYKNTPPLDIVTRFGVMAASKGHARYIWPQVVSTVIRMADPVDSAKYIRLFEEEALKWCSTKRKRTNMRKDETQKQIYSLAVRTQALAGRLDASVNLLQYARSRNISISGFTYDMLMRELKQAGKKEHLSIVQTLAPPKAAVEAIHPSPPLSFKERWKQATTLSSQLRILKGVFPYPHRSYNPIPHNQIVEFIRSYTLSGHRRALRILRNRAFRGSPKQASDWVLAEMLYYRSGAKHDLVLRTFNNYFYLKDVPGEVLCRYIDCLAKKGRGKVGKWDNLLVPGHFLTNDRLWPTPHHTAMVWASLVWVNDTQAVDKLYQELLRQAHESILTSNHKRQFDGAHFTPFMVAFAARRRMGPERCDRLARIMQDMQNLGIQPGLQHWTILAAACAQYGRARQAMAILNGMEAQKEQEAEGDIVGKEETVQFAGASLGTYNNILKGFIRAGRIRYALEMKERIKLVFPGGSDGGHQWTRTENLLKELRKLERKELVC